MTTVIRITFGALIAVLALAAFTLALLVEWVGDMTSPGPQSEDSK
jgi:hypothetical protein